MNFSWCTFTITFLWFLSCHTYSQCEEKIRIYVSIFELSLQTVMAGFNNLKMHHEISTEASLWPQTACLWGSRTTSYDGFADAKVIAWRCRVWCGAVTRWVPVPPGPWSRDAPGQVSCCPVSHVQPNCNGPSWTGTCWGSSTHTPLSPVWPPGMA